MTPRRPCIVPFIPQVLSAGGYVNDLELTNRCVDWLKVQTAAEVFLTGFTPGCEDRMLCVTNEGPEDCTLKHLTISNPGNRIFLADGRDTLVPAGYSLCLRYDVQTSPDAPDGVWREVSKFAAAGVRGYHAGDGYFGPQPDIEFLDGGGLAWTVSQDAVDKRIVVAAVASGGGGGVAAAGGDDQLVTYACTAVSAQTGCTVVLPTPGTYIVVCQVDTDATLFDPGDHVEVLLACRETPGHLTHGVFAKLNACQNVSAYNYGDSTTLVALVTTTATNEHVDLVAKYVAVLPPSFCQVTRATMSFMEVGGTGPPGPPGPPGSVTLGTTPVTGGTPGEFLTVGPGGTLSQSPGGGGGGPLTIGTTPVAGGSPGEVLTVGPDGNVGQSIGILAGTPAGGDLGGTFPNPEVLEVDGGTWE